MLSRVANSIYWMSRYIERAENVSRFVDVNLHLLLDLPEVFSGQWDALVHISGDHKDFKTRYGAADDDAVIQFLTFDQLNSNSIFSCVTAARENASSVREIISTETWEAINEFYLGLRATDAQSRALRDPHEFFRGVRKSSHLISGALAETMSRGEGWHFSRVGQALERADKTTRILDIKYFLLLPDVELIGTPIDDLHWNAVLRSASAFEMYRKIHGKVSADSIVKFLVMSVSSPTSVRFCLFDADRSMHAISGTPERSFKNQAERSIGQLVAELDYTDHESIIETGLHEMLDGLQAKINTVGEAVVATFFSLRPVADGFKPTTRAVQ
ncbi:MAG: alpha-E domain-containing protein [Acidobacteria bacterium]|nr:alpha-E domain-containing protein [Acidobacteriota bacterium]